MTDPSPPAPIWAVTTGEAGNRSQAEGLAAALGEPWRALAGYPPRPWSWLPSPWAARAGLERLLGPGSDSFSPPWPAVIVACGRRAATLALATRARCRRAGAPAPFLVQILDPQVGVRHFDMVVAPAHDRLTGPNVVTTQGALHRLTRARLAAGAEAWAPRLAGLPRPLVAVLVGGASHACPFSPGHARALAETLAAFARAHGVGLVVTPSRRTGPDNAALIARALSPLGALVWDGTGPNPYDGMLALADAILVTEESVSMVSEACFPGKPVYTLPMPGGSARHARFLADLRGQGFIRPFGGALEPWSPPAPLDEAARVAALVRQRLGWPPRSRGAER
ncbi:mitochondrial fission ELM1 family protein [Pararhodospirillum oryzae]|nr:mitochondrial fission ELM1 family protein [Pararhodospirillum oryzae]